MTASNEQLTQFSASLDKGEAELRPEFCPDVIRIALLHNHKHNAVSVARERDITPRTVNRYQTQETMPSLEQGIAILDVLGYDVIIRKKR